MFPNEDAGDASTVIGRLVLFIGLRRILNTILVCREQKKKLRPTSRKKRIYCTKFHRTKKKPLIDCAETDRVNKRGDEQENRL